jgi:hypothetical protein
MADLRLPAVSTYGSRSPQVVSIFESRFLPSEVPTMAKHDEPYRLVVVESYRPPVTSGLHGEIHIRPIAGQGLSTQLQVECSKKLSRGYPVGTRFRIQAKLTDREGGGEYLYSSYRWPVVVVPKS